VPGSNPRIDDARSRRDGIKAFLCQSADTQCGYSESIDQMGAL
jgi:flagellar biosynthesis/type III secretory pathway ATPase